MIPADIDGRTWASYGRTLHELRWMAKGVDIAFEIWDRWSSTSQGKGPNAGEYKGRADLAKRWQRFEETSASYSGVRVTVASIYHRGKRMRMDRRLRAAAATTLRPRERNGRRGSPGARAAGPYE